MAKKTQSTEQVKFSWGRKRTSIGGGQRKTSSMNKHQRRNWKPSRGQGNPR